MAERAFEIDHGQPPKTYGELLGPYLKALPEGLEPGDPTNAARGSPPGHPRGPSRRPPPCSPRSGAAYNRRENPHPGSGPPGAFADVTRRGTSTNPTPPSTPPDPADAARPPAGVVGAGPGHAGPRVGLALPPPLLPGRPRRRWRISPRRPGAEGRRQILEALDRGRPGAPEQLHAFAVPGHKADFGLMLAGTDLRAIHGIQLAIQASALGPALVPTYSFYSITEISEYVPDVEAYGKILRDREGVDPESRAYKAKVAAYADRLGPMNKQRLFPEFPDWPCLCFYPMSKMRQGEQNWYTPALRGAVRADEPARPERHEVRGEGLARSSPRRPASTTGNGASPSGRGTRRTSRTSSTRCGSTRARRGTPCSATSTSATSCRPAELLDTSGSECRRTRRARRSRNAPMWTCPKCASKVDPSFEVCWNCGTSPDGVGRPDVRHGRRRRADRGRPVVPELDVEQDVAVARRAARADPRATWSRRTMALDLMEAKFLADQLNEAGIQAVSDTHDLHQSLGPRRGRAPASGSARKTSPGPGPGSKPTSGTRSARRE